MTTTNTATATHALTGLTTIFRLGQYDLICIDGNERVFQSKTSHGYVLKQISHPWASEEFTFEDLDRLYKEGRLSVTANHYSSVEALRRLENPLSMIADLSPQRQDNWAANLRMVEAFLLKEAEGLYSRSDADIGRFLREYVADLAKQDQTRTGTVLKSREGLQPDGSA